MIHYTRAAHELGLWESERQMIERFLPDKAASLLEAGCGAGRVTLGLWALGYHDLTAFDFARELVDQATSLAIERKATAINFFVADATKLGASPELNTLVGPTIEPSGAATIDSAENIAPQRSAALPPIHPRLSAGFNGALFMFNGLMQIPGRKNRRAALKNLHTLCCPGAPLLFTTHDRDHSPTERALWRLETIRWVRGEQDPRLVEFGDRYFEDEAGRTFMHLPDRREILEDLAATGWQHRFDAMRAEIAKESKAVGDFSDECRFWAAERI